MRYANVLVGYFAVTFAVLGIAGAGIGNLNGMTAKQNRELDAEINRLVAQHNERKQLVALADKSGGPRSSSRETTGSAGQDSGESQRQLAAKNATSASVVTARRSGRRGRNNSEHFIPLAFTSLPKFTAYNLLGLR